MCGPYALNLSYSRRMKNLRVMYIVHCIRCSINYMKGTGIELCYMAVLPHDSSYFWRVVNAKVKVKIGNKVEPRSFKISFIQNPTRSNLITQPALVLALFDISI